MTLFNRRRAHVPTYPEPGVGGLDDVIWATLCGVVTAVSTGTPSSFLEALHGFSDRLSFRSQRLYGYYVYYLLKCSLENTLGAAPTEAQFHAVASHARARFRSFLPHESPVLEDVLRTPFALQRTEIEGVRYTICASVALGALLDDPTRQLDVMRPALDVWCAKGAATIRRVCEEVSA